jgi:hypothetical protein
VSIAPFVPPRPVALLFAPLAKVMEDQVPVKHRTCENRPRASKLGTKLRILRKARASRSALWTPILSKGFRGWVTAVI